MFYLKPYPQKTKPANIISYRILVLLQGLRPYSVYQAIGANLLLNVNKGQYSKTDIYWAHAQLSPEDRADVLLITTK